MKYIAIVAAASLASIVLANPVTVAPERPHPSHHAFCDELAVRDVLSILANLGSQASAYCSSLIGTGVEDVTKTTTNVVRHTVPSTVKATATSTKTVGGPSSVVTVTVYSNCALEGYAKNPAYHVDTTVGTDNFVSCSAECQADKACVSFAFGSGQCLLFNQTAPSNVNVAATSPYAFFDRNCPISSASTPPSARAQRRQVGLPPVTIGNPGQPAPTISISNPQIASEACTCLIGDSPTKAATVTVTKLVTSDIGVTTTVTVATVTATVSTLGGYSTVTVTTTA